MTIKEYMKKTGVTKRKYVEKWIKEGLIPGVEKDKNTGELIFPRSARRPYRPRLKANSDASVIRASILNACLKREYISAKIYYMSDGEFLSLINDLLVAELISQRDEDGVTYYDSTIKSDTCRGKSIQTIRRFVIDCLGEVSERVSYGVTKALCEEVKIA